MHLFDVSNRHIRAERELTPQEESTWVDAVGRIEAFRTAGKLVSIVGMNRIAMREFLVSTNQIVKAMPDHHSVADTLSMEANRLAINFLASTRLLLDSTEGRLKSIYGDSGAPVLAFKSRTAEAYDKVFGYRFLYRLRNVSQHAGLPIGHVNVHSVLLSPGAPKSAGVRYIVLAFDRDQLLALGRSYWGPVKAELEAGPKELEILPLVEDAMTELVAIDEVVKAVEHGPLRDLALSLRPIAEPVLSRGGTPQVGSFTQDGARMDFRFIRPPLDVMEWLGVPELAQPV